MPFNVKDKVVLVTGATKGLGRSMTERFAENGAKVIVVSRNQGECAERAAALAEQYGVETLAHSCDVKSPLSIDDLVKCAVERFGRIDVLVNNAGVAVTKASEELTEQDWDQVIDTNLKGVFFLSQAVGRQMILQKGGRIINVASMFGLVGDKNILPYLASKGGVIQLTKGLALEWAKHNILVNAVAPGYVVTEINREVLTDAAIQARMFSRIPLRRYASGKEVAGTVLYLACDEASYVTGCVYSVDGGWTAQ